jgi:hypothetical protein
VAQYLYIPPNIYDILIRTCVDGQPDDVQGALIGDSPHISSIRVFENKDDRCLNQYIAQLSKDEINVVALFHSASTPQPVPTQQAVKDWAFLNAYHVMVSVKSDYPVIGAWYIGDSVEHVPIIFDLEQLDSRSSIWTQNQNIAMIIITAFSIIALIILSIILLPPAP